MVIYSYKLVITLYNTFTQGAEGAIMPAAGRYTEGGRCQWLHIRIYSSFIYSWSLSSASLLRSVTAKRSNRPILARLRLLLSRN